MADFTIDTGNPVQESPGAGAQAVQANVQSTGQQQATLTAEAPQIDTGMNAETARALDTLSAGILGPKIKEAAQQQFMEGVQRAAAGEAVKDIVQDQPGLTQIFGPSSAVQGARAYTVQKQVADFGAAMEGAMPALSQHGPEVLQAKINELSKSLRTGDPATDLAITGAIVDQTVPLYKQQAKGHYIYQQTQANEAQVRAMVADTDAYQRLSARAAAGDPTLGKGDLQQAQNRLLGGWEKFADQTDASYEKNITATLAMAADKGNFQVVKLFKENGLLNQLPPESQSKLEAHFHAAGAKALSQAMPQFAVDIATLQHDFTQNPAGIAAKVAALNAKAAGVTGVGQEYAQMIPASAIVSTIGSTMVHQQTAAVKAQEEARKQSAADTALTTPGGVSVLTGLGITDSAHVETALAQQFSLQDPKRAALIANNVSEDGHKTAVIQAAFSSAISPDEAGGSSQNLLDTYRGMGNKTKGAYFGSDGAAERRIMDSLDKMVAGGMPIKAAWVASKQLAPLSDDAIPADAKPKILKAIQKVSLDNNSALWGYGFKQIDDNSVRLLEGVVNEAYKQTAGKGLVAPDVAAERAYYSAMHDGKIARFGEHYMLTNPKNPGVTDRDFYLAGKDNVGLAVAGEAFNQLYHEKLEASGVGKGGRNFIYRMPDVNGVPQYMSMPSDDKGQSHIIQWNGAEVKAKALVVEKRAAVPTALSPGYLVNPTGDTPQIYGSP